MPERAQVMTDSSSQQSITLQMVSKFAKTARARMRIDGGGYRRDHLRALAQRVEVADKEVRIMGSKSDLLRTLAAGASVTPARSGVRSSVLKWQVVPGGRPNDSTPFHVPVSWRVTPISDIGYGYLWFTGKLQEQQVAWDGARSLSFPKTSSAMMDLDVLISAMASFFSAVLLAHSLVTDNGCGYHGVSRIHFASDGTPLLSTMNSM
jgi:hypothetical protein